MIKPELIITNAARLLDLDLRHDYLPENKVHSDFRILALRSGRVDGIAIWFDVELAESITLSTSPEAPATHWKQTLLHLAEPVQVEYDQIVQGHLTLKPQKENHRALIIELEL